MIGPIKRQLSFLFVALLVMQGCTYSYSHSVDVDQISDIEIQGKDQPNRIVQAGSPNHQELLAWISDNKGGWDQYIVTLPMSEIMISTGQCSLYVAGDAIFLGQREAKMLVRKLEDDEVRFFHDLAFSDDR